MTCLKRVPMAFLSEQWRAWVFLVLNVVLVAIVFTSSFSSDEKQKFSSKSKEERVTKTETKKKISKLPCSNIWISPEVLESKDCPKIITKKIQDGYEQASMEEEDVTARLSNEELNERVEAFIFMFRQHLISDAKRSGKHFL